MLAACGGQMNLTNLSGRELMKIGMEKYDKKKYLRATEAFQALIFNYPGENYVDTAQYYLALSYFGDKSYLLAQVEFNRLLLNYPASAFASQSQLMKAVCFFKGTPEHYGLDQTDLETAVRQFEDFIIDYPESDAIEDARAYLADAHQRLAHKLYASGVLYMRVHDYKAARIYFQRVIDEYTNSEFAPLATYYTAETYLKDQDWDEAHDRFENFKIAFADHELADKAGELACEAAFEGGEAALYEGDTALARTRFERFMTVCGSDPEQADQAEKVKAYLAGLPAAPVAEADSTDVVP